MTALQSSTAGTAGWTTETVHAAGGDIPVLRGGSGAPVLVLPRETGHPPKQDFLDQLAEHYTVYYPWFPGFHGAGDVAPWEWMADARDLAVVQRQLAQALALENVTVIGLGFGGWIAAEMATMGTNSIASLVLVTPMGIQPAAGYIYDQFLVSTEAYARQGFASQSAFEAVYGNEPPFEQLESWETDREMTSRLAWKPYMYNRSLPKLLAGVTTRTLVVWGEDDKVVPPECGALYRAALPNATLDVIRDCGHAVELEQPAALAAKVHAFIQGAVRA
jgi:pimeloyl-ACP methyl ester carboxylesterase